MKIFALTIFILSFTAVTLAAEFKIPDKEEILTIAVHPAESAKIFTVEKLFKNLSKYRIGDYKEVGFKVGDDRAWQSGVIVLKNKNVLFWATDRERFLRIFHDDGNAVYLIRDDLKK